MRALSTLEIVGAILNLVWRSIEAIVSIYLSVFLLLPCVLLLWSANEVLRTIISFRLKLKYGDKLRLVQAGEDNIWSFQKPGNSRNILMLTIYRSSSSLDAKTYQEKFLRRVLEYKNSEGEKPFQKLCHIHTQKFGYGCWERDPKFDIRNHVRELSVSPANVNGIQKDFVTETDLYTVLGTLTGDLSPEHPQWEEVIIPKFVYDRDIRVIPAGDGGGEEIYQIRPGGEIRSAKIFRYHHAYMEGVSSFIMMQTCMLDNPGSVETSLDPLKPEIKTGEKFLQALNVLLWGATSLFRHIYSEANADSRFLLHRFSGQILHRWSQPIDMGLVERIGRRMGCSQSEVLASSIGGAIRIVSEKYCTKPIWLIFSDTFEDSILMGLPKFIVPYPSESPMNRFGVVNVDINTQQLSSRRERLESVKGSFRKQVKRSPVLILNYWIMRLVGRFPVRVIQYLLADAGPPVVFSNIPWIKSKLTLMGDEVEEFGGWMPMLTRTGLGVVSARYCGKMRLCGVTETSRLSPVELEFVLSQVQLELELLAKECDCL